METRRLTSLASPAQPPLRVLTYSHDSVGLGHLRRSVTMARAMTARGSHVHAMCLTGSPVPDLFRLPPNCDLVKLPAIGKSETGEYVARRLPMSMHEITALRSDLITATVRSFRPDLLLVDHTASGPGDELLPVLRRLAHERLRTRVVLGMRDVLDAPAAARDELQRTGFFDHVRRYYDQVLVYGDAAIYDTVAEYDFPEDIAAKTVFTGPVVPPEAHGKRAPRGRGAPPRLLVTTGGGEDGFELLRSAVAALRGPLFRMDLRATIVAGPLLDEQDIGALERAVTRDARITLLRSSSDMQGLMADSDLVLGMGGYNTVYECLASRSPLLAVPRTAPRREQWVRCRRLAELGALRMLEPEQAMQPHVLAAAIRAAFDDPSSPPRIACDGAESAARLCLAARRQCRSEAPLMRLG